MFTALRAHSIWKMSLRSPAGNDLLDVHVSLYIPVVGCAKTQHRALPEEYACDVSSMIQAMKDILLNVEINSW